LPNSQSKTPYVNAPWKPVDDWTTLKSQDVEVIKNGRLIDRGRVDDVTSDGSVLWLMPDGASNRRIIENLPGTFIRLA
jgi:hypothetical protein